MSAENNVMQIVGELFEVSQIEKYGKEKKHDKREFVINVEERVPQKIKFELYQQRCRLTDNFKIGEKVKVRFNIRGNVSNEKYFVNLHCFSIQKSE